MSRVEKQLICLALSADKSYPEITEILPEDYIQILPQDYTQILPKDYTQILPQDYTQILPQITHKSYLRITHKSYLRITHKSYLRITHKSYLRITHKSYPRITHILNNSPDQLFGLKFAERCKKDTPSPSSFERELQSKWEKKSELLVITISATYFSKTIIVIEFIYLTDQMQQFTCTYKRKKQFQCRKNQNCLKRVSPLSHCWGNKC